MTRRRLVAAAVGVLVLVGVAGLTVVWVFPPHPVRFAAYERVRLGMTAAEVDTVIGLPAGDYTEGQLNGGGPTAWEGRTDLILMPHAQEHPVAGETKCWSSANGVLFVQYDGAGNVVGKLFGPWGGGHISWFDRVRSWLGW